MLGMAASHLSVYGGDFESHALSHRVKAIQSLNKALSTPARCTAEADARFGTIMSLAFQASCMPEGMTEFMAMIKGCHVIATTSLRAFEDSIFHEFTRHGYTYDVRNAIGTAPVPLDPEQESLLDEFLESLRALAPLCSNPLEVRFMAATERVVRLARISAKAAFAEFGHQYTIVNLASKEEFESFMDPKNYSAQLQLIHFILIEYAIGYFALGRFGRRFAYREKSSIAWMQRVADALPDEYKKYAKWPMDFVTKRMPYL
ncbi:uncharacterized protein THITE_2063451 [Thermothielavioides terrestris NRRL 8126]|uniref:Uncharacterized protein n=1 Tax=Thermothielavioides terrestris (strain ATCC 38088 / NRRL 8126) TaxID=578455 RepID=G2QXJ8_THETT|nr:uncharacterized protein THITE_2063451 [Thermothielavioides terrestris NRRL 8126]AEO64023.1 hypothetical protein THITE_2063451 [Thermothielavioides terrestris NRRL 8126]